MWVWEKPFRGYSAPVWVFIWDRAQTEQHQTAQKSEQSLPSMLCCWRTRPRWTQAAAKYAGAKINKAKNVPSVQWPRSSPSFSATAPWTRQGQHHALQQSPAGCPQQHAAPHNGVDHSLGPPIIIIIIIIGEILIKLRVGCQATKKVYPISLLNYMHQAHHKLCIQLFHLHANFLRVFPHRI